jgi:hypothetical protein
MDRSDAVRWDDHLESEVEDRLSGALNGEPTDDDGRATDPELEAWLRAREADLAEQSFALADQFGREW